MHRNSKPKTMQEQRVDPRLTTAEEHAEGVRQAQVLFKLNHTMPYTDKYNALVRELFGDNISEGSWVMPRLTGVCFDRVHIGKNVMIMNNCLMMARGGITIDDGAMIAANAQLISNNHDLYDRQILLCKPVHICENVWIGAGDNYSVGNIEVGNTKIVADYITESKGADQFEIVTHKYDGMAYMPLIELAKEEAKKGELPPYEGTAALRRHRPRPQPVRHRLHRRSCVVGHLPAGDVHAVQGHQPRRKDRHPLHHPRGQRAGLLR